MDPDTIKKLDESRELIDRLQKSAQKSAALEVQVSLQAKCSFHQISVTIQEILRKNLEIITGMYVQFKS